MRGYAFAFAAVAAALLIVPVAASGHTRLVASTPAAGSVVSRITSVSLRFSEAVIPATAKTTLVMDGMPGMTGHAAMQVPHSSMVGKDGKSMMLMLERPLAAGTYRVNWAAAGADTHRMEGEFSFTVK